MGPALGESHKQKFKHPRALCEKSSGQLEKQLGDELLGSWPWFFYKVLCGLGTKPLWTSGLLVSEHRSSSVILGWLGSLLIFNQSADSCLQTFAHADHPLEYSRGSLGILPDSTNPLHIPSNVSRAQALCITPPGCKFQLCHLLGILWMGLFTSVCLSFLISKIRAHLSWE